MGLRSPFTALPRPLTSAEVAAARALLAEVHVTRAWLVMLRDGTALELLEPPKLSRSDHRRGGASDLSLWRRVDASAMLDPTLYRAAVERGSQ